MHLPERPAGYDRARHGVHLLRSPEVIADPSVYIDAIAELGPLFYDEVGSVWVCSGYAQAVEILRDHSRFSSVREYDHAALRERGLHTSAALSAMVHEQMLFLDPPQHSAVRSTLAGQFSGKRIKSRESDLRAIADRALEGLPAEGVLDLVDDFAAKLPATLVAYLLGMPGREDDLTRWAEAYERLLGNLSALQAPSAPQVERDLTEALSVLQQEAQDRLRAPGTDVISSLTTPWPTGRRAKKSCSPSPRTASSSSAAATRPCPTSSPRPCWPCTTTRPASRSCAHSPRGSRRPSPRSCGSTDRVSTSRAGPPLT